MASNEIFNFSNKILFLINSLFSILFLLTFFLDKNILINNLINNYEIINLNYLNRFINDHALSLIKLYNFPTNLITLLLINYLLFTLIIIVKITNSKVGPLRISFKI